MVFHSKGRPKGKKVVEFDTSLTEFPVCPHCGFEDEEWDSSESDPQKKGRATCKECGRRFKYYEEVEISYTTHKIKRKAAKCQKK